MEFLFSVLVITIPLSLAKPQQCVLQPCALVGFACFRGILYRSNHSCWIKAQFVRTITRKRWSMLIVAADLVTLTLAQQLLDCSNGDCLGGRGCLEGAFGSLQCERRRQLWRVWISIYGGCSIT